MQVGEIASPTARHKDFFTDLVGTLENDNTPPALAGRNRAHQAGGTSAKNDYIKPGWHRLCPRIVEE